MRTRLPMLALLLAAGCAHPSPATTRDATPPDRHPVGASARPLGDLYPPLPTTGASAPATTSPGPSAATGATSVVTRADAQRFARSYLERLSAGLRAGSGVGLLDDADAESCLGCARLARTAATIGQHGAHLDREPWHVRSASTLSRDEAIGRQVVRVVVDQSAYTALDARGHRMTQRDAVPCTAVMRVTLDLVGSPAVLTMEREPGDACQAPASGARNPA